jgi:hypothetical protein
MTPPPPPRRRPARRRRPTLYHWPPMAFICLVRELALLFLLSSFLFPSLKFFKNSQRGAGPDLFDARFVSTISSFIGSFCCLQSPCLLSNFGGLHARKLAVLFLLHLSFQLPPSPAVHKNCVSHWSNFSCNEVNDTVAVAENFNISRFM